MNIFHGVNAALLLAIATFGTTAQAQPQNQSQVMPQGQSRFADSIVCSPADAQEMSAIILGEQERGTGGIYNSNAWNNYFAHEHYTRTRALSLFACVRNTITQMDIAARAETDPVEQENLFRARDTLTVVYVAMGKAIAPNVPVPGVAPRH